MIRATMRFKDLEADCIREVGDQWETTDEREAAIIASKFAEKVNLKPEKVIEEPKKANVEPKKPRTTKTAVKATKTAKKTK